MQSDKVRAFKNELKNYKYYQLVAETLKKDIELCYYRLGGVRACDPSKEPIHGSPNKEYEWRVREDISNYEARLTIYLARIDEIEKILAILPSKTRNMIEDIYIQGMTYDKVASKYYFAKSTISERIDKELEKVLY